MSFFVYVIFFFQFRITSFFCNVLFCNIRKFIWLVIYLDFKGGGGDVGVGISKYPISVNVSNELKKRHKF